MGSILPAGPVQITKGGRKMIRRQGFETASLPPPALMPERHPRTNRARPEHLNPPRAQPGHRRLPCISLRCTNWVAVTDPPRRFQNCFEALRVLRALIEKFIDLAAFRVAAQFHVRTVRSSQTPAGSEHPLCPVERLRAIAPLGTISGNPNFPFEKPRERPRQLKFSHTRRSGRRDYEDRLIGVEWHHNTDLGAGYTVLLEQFSGLGCPSWRAH
jgi:hypothetical protein